MPYEIVSCKYVKDAVRVEVIGPEGEVFVTLFFEPRAWMRAHQYAEWLHLQDPKNWPPEMRSINQYGEHRS
jgi:hypothetical protein